MDSIIKQRKTITPIDGGQRRRVEERTRDCLDIAGRELHREFASIPVLFDLKGRSAGMYRVNGNRRVIRYNPWLFARYFDSSLVTTVPHEVSHYIVDVIYGMNATRPHGPEWRRVMRLLGAEPDVRGDFDMAGIPSRRQRRFLYACQCRRHRLSTVRHNRAQKQCMIYLCKYCHATLVYTGDEAGASRK